MKSITHQRLQSFKCGCGTTVKYLAPSTKKYPAAWSPTPQAICERCYENDVICIGIKKRAMVRKHLIKRGVELPTDEAETNKLIDQLIFNMDMQIHNAIVDEEEEKARKHLKNYIQFD